MRYLTFALTLILFSSCKPAGENRELQPNQKIITADTLVGRKIITDEIAGSAYRERAIGYFVITNSDTSDLTCIFMESKDMGKISIDLHTQSEKSTYRQRLTELKYILPEAAKDFNFDSLTSIYLGRLIFNGDIAIDITKQYEEKFGTSDKLADHETMEDFLKQSKLGMDLNEAFKQYSIYVDKVSIEKLFYTTKEELVWASIETDTATIPDRILDCMTWAILKRQSNSQKIKVDNALKFINGYVENSNKLADIAKIVEWVNSNNLVTKKFKAELKRMIDEAYRREPEIGLGFDPILDAQDSPDKGFELETFDEKTNFLTVLGIDWKEFKVTMKVIEENGNWLVDGCGIVNMPGDKRARR